MKRTKLLYLGLFLAAFFTVVVVLGSLNAPQEQKTAEETKCVASSLAGAPLVNGLGNDIKIPLFPDAKRLSFADTGASQYIAKAQDVEILSFYTDRMRSLCWQVKEQKQNEIVYAIDSKAVRIALLTNPLGKTVIDYVVLSPEGVLGTVKIAQQTCSEGQFYCNGGCIPTGTECLPPPGGSGTPPDSSSCSGGNIWCPSPSGSGGWCQMPPCPSSTPPPTSGPSCSGTYQQSGMTTPACNYSVCPSGCNWGSDGCPSGCMSSTPTPPPSSTCSSGQVWCPGSNGAPGWCQMPPCPPSTTTSCSSGQYMCNGACITNGSTCSPTAWPTDQTSCTSQGKSWCTPSAGGAGWCQTGPCPTYQTPTTCPAGQYMCNGACMPSGTTCPTTTSWPTDQASCGTRGYFWCPGTSGSAGWCSSSSCPNLSATCPDGQWNCDSTCISTGMSCNGSPYTGAKSNQPTTKQPMNCMASQQYCPSSNSCIAIGGLCGGGTTTQGYQQQPPYSQPQGQYQPGGPGDQFGQGPGMGPSEEEQKRMQEQQFQQMKKGTNQFAKGVTQMTKFVNQMKTKLAKSGVGIPAELTNALAKAPELIAKLKSSKNMDEFQELMGDMQDIGMTMQEWGPKLGELQRLVDMMKNLDKDVKNMRTNFTRVQKAAKKRPELAEPLKDVEAMFNDMAKAVADVKALAKTDPEGALDLVDEFYGNTEEFWNQLSFLEMVSNMTRGLTQANTQIRQIESRIRTMEKRKGADKEFIALLKEMVAAVKAALPELKAAMATRPIDYEEVKILAEDFWMQLQDLQNTMADQGQSFYMPTVKQDAGINVVIPEGFTSNSGGGGQSAPAPLGPAF